MRKDSEVVCVEADTKNRRAERESEAAMNVMEAVQVMEMMEVMEMVKEERRTRLGHNQRALPRGKMIHCNGRSWGNGANNGSWPDIPPGNKNARRRQNNPGNSAPVGSVAIRWHRHHARRPCVADVHATAALATRATHPTHAPGVSPAALRVHR